MTSLRTTNRAVDAVANRLAEGLRVLEDLARFIGDDRELAATLRERRHAVRLSSRDPSLLAARDVVGDVAANVPSPGPRLTLVDSIRANARRVQEAGRSLTEMAADADLAAAGAAARYAAYQAELRLLSRLSGWRLWSVRLYVLVDTGLCADPVAVAIAAARGGAGAIQLRGKNLSERAYHDLAARVQDGLAGRDCLFIVNDHVAVARILHADGIHVGQDDLDPMHVRSVVGPMCAVGVSCHNRAHIDTALAGPADYLGLGPMFATATKPHEPVQGPGLLQGLPTLTKPSYAIGGLDVARIRAIRCQLPHGVAVAGAVCRADDPERATAELLELIGDPDP